MKGQKSLAWVLSCLLFCESEPLLTALAEPKADLGIVSFDSKFLKEESKLNTRRSNSIVPEIHTTQQTLTPERQFFAARPTGTVTPNPTPRGTVTPPYPTYSPIPTPPLSNIPVVPSLFPTPSPTSSSGSGSGSSGSPAAMIAAGLVGGLIGASLGGAGAGNQGGGCGSGGSGNCQNGGCKNGKCFPKNNGKEAMSDQTKPRKEDKEEENKQSEDEPADALNPENTNTPEETNEVIKTETPPDPSTLKPGDQVIFTAEGTPGATWCGYCNQYYNTTNGYTTLTTNGDVYVVANQGVQSYAGVPIEAYPTTFTSTGSGFTTFTGLPPK